MHEVKMQKITSVFHNDPQKYHVQLEDDDHPEKDTIFLKIDMIWYFKWIIFSKWTILNIIQNERAYWF